MHGYVIQGKVTRTMDFGAFVELEPGVEGLIHISELGAQLQGMACDRCGETGARRAGEGSQRRPGGTPHFAIAARGALPEDVVKAEVEEEEPTPRPEPAKPQVQQLCSERRRRRRHVIAGA